RSTSEVYFVQAKSFVLRDIKIFINSLIFVHGISFFMFLQSNNYACIRCMVLHVSKLCVLVA
ncbi:TPA: hypothetical protein ACJF1E_001643, partial [Salmonella enterica subsp. enterica serovar Paratyphi A]